MDSLAARRLLAIGAGGRAAWGTDELKVAWDSLLQTGLASIASEASRGAASALEVRIADVVHASERQPAETLRALKEWAQQVMREAERHQGDGSPIPPQAASVLYHLAIVLAQMWHGAALTNLDDATLNEGVRWASRQMWVDPVSLAIFARWLIAAG